MFSRAQRGTSCATLKVVREVLRCARNDNPVYEGCPPIFAVAFCHVWCIVRPLKIPMNAREEQAVETTGSSFRISSAPVVPFEENRPGETEAFADLPRSYGQSIVFAMARDPETLFVYWDIDWPRVFAAAAPVNRKVYLRLQDDAGAEVDLISVEAMGKNCEVNVEPGSSYRVDIGYFDQTQTWRSAGASEIVQTPIDKMGTLSAGDFALVPFHITFQRLTELFRATRVDEGSLVQSLTHLQEKSLHPEVFGSLAPEEREVYRAMKASVSERTYLPRIATDRVDEMRLQKRLESVLGFGAAAFE